MTWRWCKTTKRVIKDYYIIRLFLSLSVAKHSEEILWILMSNILRKLWCVPAVSTESMLQIVQMNSKAVHLFLYGKIEVSQKFCFEEIGSTLCSALRLYRNPKLYETAVTYEGSHIFVNRIVTVNAVHSQNLRICALSLEWIRFRFLGF